MDIYFAVWVVVIWKKGHNFAASIQSYDYAKILFNIHHAADDGFRADAGGVSAGCGA